MKSTTKATRPEHLETCLELLTDRHLYTPEEQRSLIRFWGELISSGCSYSGIAVDTIDNSILSFSVTVCIPEQLAAQIRQGQKPYIGRHIFQQWMKGKQLYLSDREIGKYNARDGVHLLTIHNGYRPFDHKSYADLRVTLIQVFIDRHMGLNISSFAHELYGEPEETVSKCGVIIHHYDDHLHPQLLQDPVHLRPYLTTLCRSGAADQRGNFLTDRMAFGHNTPRFLFSEHSRQLLRTALENDTDRYSTQRLHLSVAAIKKRWATVYEQIEVIDSALLERDANRNTTDENTSSGRRGPEFRRQVIAYLREHPEELHPYFPET